MKKPDSSLPLVLGTRGSALALAQAAMTRIALEEALGLAVEQRIIKTVGDQRQDLKLSEFSTPAPGQEAILDKGIFTKELESALREGEIDAAVHSLKDVPTELEADFEIAGVLPRAAVEDVLLSRCYDGIEELPRGARVATSSVRRRRLLEHLRPDLEVVEIRGNVGTRLRKLVEQEELDGILLARAGLERLGHAGLEDGVLEAQGVRLRARILGCEEFLPAAGQGIVGIEIRVGDERVRAAMAAEGLDALVV
ncbi:MAG: hydroxymethylbilane synthase, partial [Verrucomicrobiales bacterium]